jgi:hypothetical protein
MRYDFTLRSISSRNPELLAEDLQQGAKISLFSLFSLVLSGEHRVRPGTPG